MWTNATTVRFFVADEVACGHSVDARLPARPRSMAMLIACEELRSSADWLPIFGFQFRTRLFGIHPDCDRGFGLTDGAEWDMALPMATQSGRYMIQWQVVMRCTTKLLACHGSKDDDQRRSIFLVHDLYFFKKVKCVNSP